MSGFEASPVLITQEDLKDLSDDASARHRFAIEEMAELLEFRATEARDTVAEATGLLLTRAAVALVHVDITKTEPSYFLNDERTFYDYNRGLSIGFNDHCGGSESDFKILLNGSPDGQRGSYVLYSPPAADGRPSNTCFRKCDFTFLGSDSRGPYDQIGYVPNTLKTAGAAANRGLRYFKYFLFGGPDAPQLVYDKFAEAGFEFADAPYDDDIRREGEPDNAWSLRRHEDEARKELGFEGGYFWPGDQFAEQLARIGLDVPKLSEEDYPLVRPENKL